LQLIDNINIPLPLQKVKRSPNRTAFGIVVNKIEYR
jgi:hypothetical protein